MSSGDGQRGGSQPGRAAAELLCARGVSKRFAGVTALDGVDFDLRAGEVHALMGENGAGKSTLMKILSGVHTDYDGEIRIDGEPVRFASVRDAERAGHRHHPPGAEPRPRSSASPRTSSSAASR